MARSPRLNPPVTEVKFDPSHVTGYKLEEERHPSGELTSVLTMEFTGAHVVLDGSPFYRPPIVKEPAGE